MTDNTPTIHALHKSYCELSGLPLSFSMPRLYTWENWLAHGWGATELALVIRQVRKKIRDGQKWQSAVNFNRIVGDTENFSMELAEAQAGLRTARVPSGLKQVLGATGRAIEPKATPARSAAEIIRDAEAFKEFQRLKDSL